MRSANLSTILAFLMYYRITDAVKLGETHSPAPSIQLLSLKLIYSGSNEKCQPLSI